MRNFFCLVLRFFTSTKTIPVAITVADAESSDTREGFYKVRKK